MRIGAFWSRNPIRRAAHCGGCAMHGLVQYYDVPLLWNNFSFYHDPDSGSYLIAGLDNEIAEPSQFKVKGRNVDFQPDAQRRTAER